MIVADGKLHLLLARRKVDLLGNPQPCFEHFLHSFRSEFGGNGLRHGCYALTIAVKGEGGHFEIDCVPAFAVDGYRFSFDREHDLDGLLPPGRGCGRWVGRRRQKMSIKMQIGVGDGGSERICDFFATNFRGVVDSRGDIEFRARTDPQAVPRHFDFELPPSRLRVATDVVAEEVVVAGVVDCRRETFFQLCESGASATAGGIGKGVQCNLWC